MPTELKGVWRLENYWQGECVTIKFCKKDAGRLPPKEKQDLAIAAADWFSCNEFEWHGVKESKGDGIKAFRLGLKCESFSVFHVKKPKLICPYPNLVRGDTLVCADRLILFPSTDVFTPEQGLKPEGEISLLAWGDKVIYRLEFAFKTMFGRDYYINAVWYCLSRYADFISEKDKYKVEGEYPIQIYRGKADK
jgi:hypothetical protein